MKEYVVTMSIHGRASCVVEAEDEKEARDKARKCDIVRDTDELIEWGFDDVLKVEEG